MVDSWMEWTSPRPYSSSLSLTPIRMEVDHLLLETDDITPLLEVMEAHLKSRTFLVGRGPFGMSELMAMQLFRLRKSSLFKKGSSKKA